MLFTFKTAVLSSVNDVSFYVLNGNWSMWWTTCRLLPVKSKTTLRFPVVFFTEFWFYRPECQPVYPMADPIQNSSSGHRFDPFKSQNFHKSNDFMIYDIKLHKKKIQNRKTQYHVHKWPYTLFFTVFENSTLTSR